MRRIGCTGPKDWYVDLETMLPVFVRNPGTRSGVLLVRDFESTADGYTVDQDARANCQPVVILRSYIRLWSTATRGADDYDIHQLVGCPIILTLSTTPM